MRIGLISNLRGGLRRFAFTLSRGLLQKGFRVEILSPGHLSAQDIYPSSDFIRPIHFGTSAVARILTEKYDLLHCNIALLGLPAAIRSKLQGLPIVETFHGFPQWWIEPSIIQKVQYVAEHCALRFVGKSARSRISVSQFVRDAIQQKYGIDSSVIHHGIDHCSSQEATRRESRRLYGIDDDAIAILFVGRLHPYKDPITLLRAFNIVASVRRKLRLLLVGDGPLSPLFRMKIRELKLENSVVHKAHVPPSEIHSIYSAADIFCLPSITEAFGFVLLEAMDHSLPAVVSAVGALPEVLGDCGLTFRVREDDDLAHKLLRLIDDPPLRRSLGAKAQARVQTHFSVNSMVNRYVSAYENALGRD